MLHPRIDRDIAGRASFAEEMRQRGLSPETRLVSARPESASAAVAAALGARARLADLYLERLRLASGEPYLLEQVHLPGGALPGPAGQRPRARLALRAALDALRDPVVRAREALEPVLLRAREARLLDQRRGAPALLIEGIAFAADGAPVEFGRTFVRGDRSRYYVEREVDRPDRSTAIEATSAQEEEHDGERHRSAIATEEVLVMRADLGRFAVLVSVLALLLAACSASSASRAIGRVGRRRVGGRRPKRAASRPRRRRPHRCRSPASQAKPGDVVIRWFCCLGTGDAPEQVEVERKVAEDFNASHPGIHLQFEGFVYAAARRRPVGPARSGSGPDIVGPVGIGGAEAFHGQWLDLQPYIDKTGFDMSQFPESTVELYNAGGEGQVGIPYAIYPSVLFYKADMFKEAGLAEPPHEWNADYTMPDGSTRPWDYDTVKEIAKILTVDENGKDATAGGFDPEKIVQWGFEPQRDDLRQTGAYWGAGSFMADDGKTAQIPEPWAAAWKHVLRRHLDRPLQHDRGAVRDDRPQPGRLPVLCRQGRDEHELPLVDVLRRATAGDDWNMAATPAYNGKTTAAFNADTCRILKTSKNPDQAFEVLQYLLGQPGPARALRRHAGHRVAAGRLPRERSSPTTRRASIGTSPRRASPSPTSRTSSRTCPRTTRPST